MKDTCQRHGAGYGPWTALPLPSSAYLQATILGPHVELESRHLDYAAPGVASGVFGSAENMHTEAIIYKLQQTVPIVCNLEISYTY